MNTDRRTRIKFANTSMNTGKTMQKASRRQRRGDMYVLVGKTYVFYARRDMNKL